MHIRLTCDITQEQIDCGYDLTLLTLHSRFVDWLVTLDLPIVNFSIGWHNMENDVPHMIITADLLKDSEVKIDEEFFDELHLGGSDEEDA